MTSGLTLPCQYMRASAVDLHAVGSGEHIVKSSPKPLAVAQSTFSLVLPSLFPCFTPIFSTEGGSQAEGAEQGMCERLGGGVAVL